MRIHLTHTIWLILCLVVLANVFLYQNYNQHRHFDICFHSNCSPNVRNHTIQGTIRCNPDVPCEYPDSVDLRIVVITFQRNQSLSKLLRSLDDIILDGASSCLEIWIDRNTRGEVDKDTLEVANSFKWKLGCKHVTVQKVHVGIYGQWIDTWRPKPNSSELCLFLEDDLSVSPFIWRWLKAVHRHYGYRDDVSGYTLQSENVRPATTWGKEMRVPKDTVFLYRLMSPWGFAPHPKIWPEFQDWFHSIYKKNSTFQPYVPGIIQTRWYKIFQRSNRADSMWTMWFQKYCDIKKLYTLHNNLNNRYGTKKKCLSVNRREPGLHFFGKGIDNTNKLLRDWTPEYDTFPKAISKYDYNGKVEKINSVNLFET